MRKFDSQSQVIMMCGISGSGKTHYALQLEEKGFSRLTTDALIWQKACGRLWDLSKEEQKRLFTECGEELQRLLIDHLKKGEKVVVDATHCKRNIRDEIRKICTGLGIKHQFIYCYAEKEELWRRLSRRKGSGPDDLIVTEDELNSYWRGFERPQEDESDFIFYKTD